MKSQCSGSYNGGNTGLLSLTMLKRWLTSTATIGFLMSGNSLADSPKEEYWRNVQAETSQRQTRKENLIRAIKEAEYTSGGDLSALGLLLTKDGEIFELRYLNNESGYMWHLLDGKIDQTVRVPFSVSRSTVQDILYSRENNQLCAYTKVIQYREYKESGPKGSYWVVDWSEPLRIGKVERECRHRRITPSERTELIKLAKAKDL